MVMKLLHDDKTYEMLPNNPTNNHLTELKTILLDVKFNGLITEKEYRFCFNPTPTLVTFYTLPKIHKPSCPVRGRQTVSGNDI